MNKIKLADLDNAGTRIGTGLVGGHLGMGHEEHLNGCRRLLKSLKTIQSQLIRATQVTHVNIGDCPVFIPFFDHFVNFGPVQL